VLRIIQLPQSGLVQHPLCYVDWKRGTNAFSSGLKEKADLFEQLRYAASENLFRKISGPDGRVKRANAWPKRRHRRRLYRKLACKNRQGSPSISKT
jgi:hypothetical protein